MTTDGNPILGNAADGGASGGVPLRTGFDHLTEAVATSRACAAAAVREQGELRDVAGRMMQEAAEHMADGFARVVRARTPAEAATAYVNYLLTTSRLTMRQMGAISSALARWHAGMMEPFASVPPARTAASREPNIR